MCSALKEDLNATPAELLLRQPLCLPDIFPQSSADRSLPVTHSFPSVATCCFPCSCVFIFKRNGAHRSPLQQPYGGLSLEATAKGSVLDMGGLWERVTLDRLKTSTSHC